MKLIKNGDIVEFYNQGTIDAYKAAGYTEYTEPVKQKQTEKPATKTGGKK